MLGLLAPLAGPAVGWIATKLGKEGAKRTKGRKVLGVPKLGVATGGVRGSALSDNQIRLLSWVVAFVLYLLVPDLRSEALLETIANGVVPVAEGGAGVEVDLPGWLDAIVSTSYIALGSGAVQSAVRRSRN